MSKLQLNDVERAKIAHGMLRHCSLQRAAITASRVTGLPQVTKAGVTRFCNEGCDVCNAYKLKIRMPKEKHAQDIPKHINIINECYYDQFGPLSVKSAGDGFHYAHIFRFPLARFNWIEGYRNR